MGKTVLARLRGFWFSFWALPLIYIVGAIVIFYVAGWADTSGGSSWLARQPWPFSMTGDTALEAVSSIVTVLVSLVALFFSITLIVMTMAASNLGVRLIDRWVGDIAIRSTLSLLLGMLTYALILQAAIDPAGPDERLPRLSLLILIASLIISFAWLAKAFDHLSRRIHVDTSIAELGRDLEANLAKLARFSTMGTDFPDWSSGHACASNVAGYVNKIDLKTLVDVAENFGLLLHMPLGQGDYVHEGDALLRIVGPEKADADKLVRHIGVAAYRDDEQGATFEAALLSEIAARALSPAVNDVYTALDCIDHLGGGLALAFARQNGDGWFGQEGGEGRLFIPSLTPQGILRRPLDIIRQAAAPYPSASIRVLDMLGRLIRKASGDADRAWLKAQAHRMATSALEATPIEEDREDIRSALRDALSVPGMIE